jgi:hypothetical protein
MLIDFLTGLQVVFDRIVVIPAKFATAEMIESARDKEQNCYQFGGDHFFGDNGNLYGNIVVYPKALAPKTAKDKADRLTLIKEAEARADRIAGQKQQMKADWIKAIKDDPDYFTGSWEAEEKFSDQQHIY